MTEKARSPSVVRRVVGMTSVDVEALRRRRREPASAVEWRGSQQGMPALVLVSGSRRAAVRWCAVVVVLQATAGQDERLLPRLQPSVAATGRRRRRPGRLPVDAGDPPARAGVVAGAVGGGPAQLRQEAAQRVHDFHEGDATARYRRVHTQGVGSHQPDTRPQGVTTHAVIAPCRLLPLPGKSL